MMNQKEIFRKAGEILKELQEQYTFLAQDPENLNELELELFMANSSFLSDHIHILNKLNSKRGAGRSVQIPEPEPEDLETLHAEDHPEQQAEAADSDETEHEMPKEDVTKYFLLNEEEQQRLDEEHKDVARIHAEDAVEQEAVQDEDEESSRGGMEEPEDGEEEEEEPAAENEKEPEEAPDAAEDQTEAGKQQTTDEESGEDAEPEEEPAAEPGPPAKEEPATPEPAAKEEPTEAATEITQTERTIAVPVEQVQVNPEPVAEKRTLNDMFSAQRMAGQPEQRPAPAITDLKSMISLNDKLLFVKDLFNGYSLAYSEAIDIANKQPGFEAADQFLQSNYAQKNNWADKQHTVDKLYEILNRRFPG